MTQARFLHDYPLQLAEKVRERWPADDGHGPTSAILKSSALELLLSICYQASLMREEERPVTLRLLIAQPTDVVGNDDAADDPLRLRFERPRPCNEDELRRMSPALDYHRGMVGVQLNKNGELELWGVVQTGSQGLRAAFGGRGRGLGLPSRLQIAVGGPGQLSISRGLDVLATLRAGTVLGQPIDVLRSEWLSEFFTAEREEVRELHRAARAQADEDAPWARLDPDFDRRMGQQVLRRVVDAVRLARHGGTLLFLPTARVETTLAHGNPIRLKYEFADEPPRQSFRELLVEAMNALAARHGQLQPTVGWSDFLLADDKQTLELEQSIYEFGRLIAGLAAVDGALVLSKRFELIGFGGFIGGALDEVDEVRRALDVEASRARAERTDSVGARHRSVYRLCTDWHDVLGIVVSSDGNVRFVKWHDGALTCWDHEQEIVP